MYVHSSASILGTRGAELLCAACWGGDQQATASWEVKQYLWLSLAWVLPSCVLWSCFELPGAVPCVSVPVESLLGFRLGLQTETFVLGRVPGRGKQADSAENPFLTVLLIYLDSFLENSFYHLLLGCLIEAFCLQY